MKRIKELKKIFDLITLIITILLWLFLNFSGIQYSFFKETTFKEIWIYKILHFIFLYVIIYFIKLAIHNRKNKQCKHGIIISIIFLILNLILLLMIWPGTWAWDDTVILYNAQDYMLVPWHHFISSYFQILCLQTIPFATGVIIMQILIASMIVGYCVSKVAFIINKSNKKIIISEILLFIVTIFPPIIMYLFSGFRMAMYSFLELLLITKLFVTYKEQRMSIISLILTSILVILVASWRTEGFYYLFFYLIILLFMGKKVISLKAIFASMLVCIIAVIGIGRYNNKLIGNNNYSIVATIIPIQDIIRNIDVEDSIELELIDKVIDVNKVKEKEEGYYYWTDLIRWGYTEEDYQNYMSVYVKLLFKYPNVAFKSMWDIFYSASGIDITDGFSSQTNLVNGALILYEKDSIPYNFWQNVRGNFTEPINAELRVDVISAISGIYNDYKVNNVYRIFWNLFIPFILTFICLIYKLIKKDWFMSLLIITVLCRIPIVFATSSASFMMYYLSTYLLSYFITSLTISETIGKIKIKKTKPQS